MGPLSLLFLPGLKTSVKSMSENHKSSFRLNPATEQNGLVWLGLHRLLWFYLVCTGVL